MRGTRVSLKNTPVSLKSTPVSLNSTQVSLNSSPVSLTVSSLCRGLFMPRMPRLFCSCLARLARLPRMPRMPRWLAYCIHSLLSTVAWDSRGGGEFSQKNWIGVCGPLPKTLTLLMTKICYYPYPIYDLTKNLIPIYDLILSGQLQFKNPWSPACDKPLGHVHSCCKHHDEEVLFLKKKT